MLDVERMRETVSLDQVEAATLGEITDMGEESKAGDGTLRAIGADEVLSAAAEGRLL